MQFKATTAAAALILSFALAPVSAQEKPFNAQKMGASEAQKRLETSIRLSLASRSCKLETPLADKDDVRLTSFINALQKKLRLDANRLERVYYVKSFDEYEKDEAKFCETWAKQIPDFVKRLP